MSSRDPAMSEGLRRVLARLDSRVQEVANLTRLSAGATNETWSLDAVRDAGVEQLILRRSAVGRGPGVLKQQEAESYAVDHFQLRRTSGSRLVLGWQCEGRELEGRTSQVKQAR